MNSNVVFMPLRELAELVRTRQVSPEELAEIFLERLENLGSKYNAVVTMTRERAEEQARRATEEIAAGNYKGPLHGIPYGLKDAFATSGIPTSYGAAPLKDQTFDYDATVVQNLEKAGAVLVAKLALVELAGIMVYRQPNASFTGPGINPWDLTTWSGGSSSGSASAVCAGLVPFAIGSETWGSIIRPANNCGISGLRPTYGRVSRHGGLALCWTLDKVGPMCLNADDCGLVLESIAGHDPKDPNSTTRPFQYRVQTDRPFRLGVLKDSADGAEEEVRTNFEKTLKVFEAIATIDEVEFPDMPYEEVTRIIMMAESASAFEEFTESGQAAELTAPEDHYGPYGRTAVLAKDYLRALRLRSVICREIDEVMSPYDALLAPGRLTVAAPIDQPFLNPARGVLKDVIGAVGNSAGLPAISVPNGFNDNGLPTGLQIMGRAYEENKILSVACAYQSLTDWHLQHPPDLVSST